MTLGVGGTLRTTGVGSAVHVGRDPFHGAQFLARSRVYIKTPAHDEVVKVLLDEFGYALGLEVVSRPQVDVDELPVERVFPGDSDEEDSAGLTSALFPSETEVAQSEGLEECLGVVIGAPFVQKGCVLFHVCEFY